MNKLEEVVWAIKTDKLFSNNKYFQGYRTPPDKEILNRIYNDCIPLTRRECENDPNYKHIIPYILLTNETNEIFVTQRTEKQTEKRLHNKFSVGIGGHVGPTRFLTIKDSIRTGMIRELQEEMTGMEQVGNAFDFIPTLTGFVNLDDAVGAVHFGLVYELLVGLDRIKTINVKETENMVGSWMPFEEASKIKNYESWSQLILEGYGGK